MATEGVPSRTLQVELISASGLKDTEFIGKSDPYAELSVGKTHKKSKVAKDQPCNPAWNETLTLPVLEADSELLIVIKNDDTLGRDEEMARTLIPLSLIYGGSHSASTFPLELKGKAQGEIVLSLSFEGEQHGGHHEKHGLTEKVHGLSVGETEHGYGGEGHSEEGHHGGLKEKISELKEKKHRKKERKHRGSGDEGGSSSSSSDSDKDK